MKVCEHQKFGRTVSPRACCSDLRQLTNRQKWCWSRFILVRWRWFTWVVGRSSDCDFLVQPAHRKLHVVPRFIRSMSHSAACCKLIRLWKTAQHIASPPSCTATATALGQSTCRSLCKPWSGFCSLYLNQIGTRPHLTCNFRWLTADPQMNAKQTCVTD